MKEKNNLAIGIFDSGMGGVSVLAQAIKLIPSEKYIYYGDSLNAPYGEKNREEVVELSKNICNFLIGQGVKAIVVACNTATSAAIKELRKAYSIPIIGMEPALKPAVELNPKGTIVVMATNMTLKEKKFSNLMDKYGKEANIVKLPCPVLVELVEKGITMGEKMDEALGTCFSRIDIEKIDSVVLGCTHYIYLKNSIKSLLGEKVKIIDGNEGTIKHLQDILIKDSLLRAASDGKGDVKIYNSSEDAKMIELSKKLLKIGLENEHC